MKNFFYDFFKMPDLKEANIMELKRVIVFTLTDDATIRFKQYQVKQFNENLVKTDKLDLAEIGPSFTMKMKRDQIAQADHYKLACRKVKVENVDKKKFKKNMFTDGVGNTMGKIFL